MNEIAEVILWQNGNLMVFDGKGEQMPEYQAGEAIDRIIQDAPPNAKFSIGVWGQSLNPTSRERFRAACRAFEVPAERIVPNI